MTDICFGRSWNLICKEMILEDSANPSAATHLAGALHDVISATAAFGAAVEAAYKEE